jgi:hypothetical protein
MVLASFVLLGSVRAETVILHLRNGDRIAGTITSEDTNQVIVSTVWTKSLAIPLSAIERREKSPAESNESAAPATAIKTQQVTAAPRPAQTNVAAAATPALSEAKPPPPPQTKPPKHWKADVRIGMDLVEGTKDRQLYYGRAKVTYEKPYAKNPRQFFRNFFEYNAEYGMTDGELSANRMNGSSKTDFDLGKQFFGYNLGGAGYDVVRKIDLQYELGPGLGYHVITRTNLVLDTEIGLNYQVQERSKNPETRSFYLRFADTFTWRIGKKLTMTEKFEFFPNAEVWDQFRARFECTLSYWLLQYLSFNLTVLDTYDTQPARNVTPNEFQIRSSIGFVF